MQRQRAGGGGAQQLRQEPQAAAAIKSVFERRPRLRLVRRVADERVLAGVGARRPRTLLHPPAARPGVRRKEGNRRGAKSSTGQQHRHPSSPARLADPPSVRPARVSHWGWDWLAADGLQRCPSVAPGADGALVRSGVLLGEAVRVEHVAAAQGFLEASVGNASFKGARMERQRRRRRMADVSSRHPGATHIRAAGSRQAEDEPLAIVCWCLCPSVAARAEDEEAQKKKKKNAPRLAPGRCTSRRSCLPARAAAPRGGPRRRTPKSWLPQARRRRPRRPPPGPGPACTGCATDSRGQQRTGQHCQAGCTKLLVRAATCARCCSSSALDVTAARLCSWAAAAALHAPVFPGCGGARGEASVVPREPELLQHKRLQQAGGLRNGSADVLQGDRLGCCCGMSRWRQNERPSARRGQEGMKVCAQSSVRAAGWCTPQPSNCSVEWSVVVGAGWVYVLGRAPAWRSGRRRSSPGSTSPSSAATALGRKQRRAQKEQDSQAITRHAHAQPTQKSQGGEASRAQSQTQEEENEATSRRAMWAVT